MGNDEDRPEWVEAALAEYSAHRAEVLAGLQAQQHTLTFGVTAVGILVAGAFNVWDERLMASIAFLAAIPLLSIVVLIQWTGQVLGTMRVGFYLEGLERALRNELDPPKPVLMWEQGIVKRQPRRWWKPHHSWHESGTVAVFVLLSAGSIALGAYRGYDGYESEIVTIAAIAGVLLALVAVLLGWELGVGRKRVRRGF
jgi:hypothetical protein